MLDIQVAEFMADAVEGAFPQFTPMAVHHPDYLDWVRRVCAWTERPARLVLCVGVDNARANHGVKPWDDAAITDKVLKAARICRNSGVIPLVSAHADFTLPHDTADMVYRNFPNIDHAWICYPFTASCPWMRTLVPNDYFGVLNALSGPRFVIAELGCPRRNLWPEARQVMVFRQALAAEPEAMAVWGAHDAPQIYIDQLGEHWSKHGILNPDGTPRPCVNVLTGVQ
jgi:hypothetical protein